MEKKANEEAEAAERDPYKALKPRKPLFPSNIPMEVWEDQTRRVLSQSDTRPIYIERGAEREPCPNFTKQELDEAIKSLKANKAPGPDLITNEIWKDTYHILGDTWLKLMNKCLKEGDIPMEWRRATLKMLYKGKGSTESPDCYRGVALEATALKILTKMITNRISPKIEEYLPDQQCGFRKKRFTLTAAEALIKGILVEL